jgi:ketosteroid isomerase-like protein
VTRELHDVLAIDEHGIQLITVHGERAGERLTWRGVAVLHIRDGKIAEMWIHIDDQDALAEFLS